MNANNAKPITPHTSDPLWEAIDAFQIDDEGSELTFAGRLARENGWSRAFAERVIDEYKRFVYLAMVAGHEVTPSEHVDQAWHLHLTYTRSYWEEMCGQVLPAPLHHEPTQGGGDESAKFNDQYEQTLDSYRRVFGKRAPRDVWPSAKTRFGSDLAWQRINVLEHWVLRKPKAWQVVLTIAIAGGIGATLHAGLHADPVVTAVVAGLALIVPIVLIVTAPLRKAAAASSSSGGGCGFFGFGCGDGGCGSGCGGGCGGCGG